MLKADIGSYMEENIAHSLVYAGNAPGTRFNKVMFCYPTVLVLRPSKCLLHHLHRRCNIILSGGNLLLLTYGVSLYILFLLPFWELFCMKLSGNEGRK